MEGHAPLQKEIFHISKESGDDILVLNVRLWERDLSVTKICLKCYFPIITLSIIPSYFHTNQESIQ